MLTKKFNSLKAVLSKVVRKNLRPSNAMLKAFGIVEIAEQVLEHLDYSDLLAVMRVTHYFKDVVAGCEKLQRILRKEDLDPKPHILHPFFRKLETARIDHHGSGTYMVQFEIRPSFVDRISAPSPPRWSRELMIAPRVDLHFVTISLQCKDEDCMRPHMPISASVLNSRAVTMKEFMEQFRKLFPPTRTCQCRCGKRMHTATLTMRRSTDVKVTISIKSS